MSRDHGASDTKVYIGNLGSHPPSTAEVEKEMSYYGKLVSVWIARRPPGFGYIEFEDPRDAKDAIRDLDGRSDEGFFSFLITLKIKLRNFQFESTSLN